MKLKIFTLLAATAGLASCLRLNNSIQPSNVAETEHVVVLPSANEEEELSTGPQATRLGPSINSVADDFAPFRFADRIYFTSTVDGKDCIMSAMGGSAPVSLFNDKEDALPNTGNAVFTTDGQRVFFTVCEDTKQGGRTCHIYTRNRAHEGYWLPARRLMSSINSEGYTSTQPSIGFNRALRKDVLYFSTNRPGGAGGMDIWCCPIERNGTFGKSYPLPINTPANEVTPFFFQQSQTLFFSSDAGGQSGYDVYRSDLTWVSNGSHVWEQPQKLDQPFNGRFNDLYFTCHAPSGKAYFASDRPGCERPDPAQPCVGLDIFEADLETELTVEAFDAQDSSLLLGTNIKLLPFGEEVALTGFTEGNATTFRVEAGKKYKIVVSASGYFTDTLVLETSQTDKFRLLRQRACLRPNVQLFVRTFDAVDSLPIGGVAMRLSTDKGGSTSVQNAPEVSSHKFLVGLGEVVTLQMEKPGYATAFANPSIHPFKEGAYLDVYLSPFTDVPFSLYFDNAQPKGERPMDAYTRQTYGQAFNNFLNRKQVYLEQATAGLPPEVVEAVRKQMLSFFEDEVQVGHARLNLLCSQLESYLVRGYRLEVLAEGETSPGASPEYNQRLAERRISAVLNHLKSWKNGSLRQYVANGRLTLKGSVKPSPAAPAIGTTVDRRVTEFGLEASKMRRVIVTTVRRPPAKV